MATIGSTYRRNRPAQLVDLTLILVVLLVGWVIVSEVFHISSRQGERGEASRAVTFTITGSELGQADWRVGTLGLAKQGAVYEARIVDKAGLELFKLNVDARTGELLGQGEKASAQATTAALPAEDAKKHLETLLDDLRPGQAQQKANGAFLEVALTYQGREVARIKADPASRQAIPEGQRIAGGQAESPRAEADDEEGGGGEGERPIVRKNLVVPLGWGAALIMILSTLYYSWKRSLYGPLRAAGGEAKLKAIAGLRSTLQWHMVLGLAAVGIAVFHVLNFTAKIQLSVSWLTLGMALTVAMSGAFGRFLARSDVVRRNWRRFHVPYTLLFFVVLLVHILEKTKVIGVGD
ncbi:MAG: hypothetical protein HYX89_08175 [Chloroflexi bacterium]|nr:hypothetical protein [Chloroflexota bacterium]